MDVRRPGESILVELTFWEAEHKQCLAYSDQYKSPSRTPYYNSIRLQAQNWRTQLFPMLLEKAFVSPFVLLRIYEKILMRLRIFTFPDSPLCWLRARHHPTYHNGRQLSYELWT